VPGGLVPDGFVSPAFTAEHRMLGFDVLVWAGCRSDSDELGEQLPTEQTVVLQSLIAAFELGYAGTGAPASGVTRWHRLGTEAREQIGPEIGHSLSVSPVLRQ
jgi:hypothetical protein